MATPEMLEGWVVVRFKPWEIHGPFPYIAIAQTFADSLNKAPNPEFIVKWGVRARSDLNDNEKKIWKGLEIAPRAPGFVNPKRSSC
jgi:hypothetical protein